MKKKDTILFSTESTKKEGENSKIDYKTKKIGLWTAVSIILVGSIVTLTALFLPSLINPSSEEDIGSKTLTEPSITSADQVIENYLEAIGGRDKLAKVTSLRKEGKISVMGMDMGTKEVWKGASSYAAKQSTPQGDVHIILTEGKAAMISPMGSRDFPEEAALVMKFDKAMFPELVYADLGIETALEGIEKLGEEKEAYKIAFSTPGGTTMNRWYDVESGLCVKVAAQDSEAIHNEYTSVEGIKFPSNSMMKAQKMEMNVIVITDTIEVNGEIDDAMFNIE